MALGTLTNVVAIVVSIMALAVSSFLARRQLTTSRRSNDTVVALDWLTRELISESFLESDAYVLDRLTHEYSPEAGVSGLPPEARAHVLRVGRYYASLGHLVVFNVVDERLVLSLVHRRIYRAWLAIAPFARAEQELRQAPIFAFFEHIACRASEVDVSQIHRKLGLRRFADEQPSTRTDLPDQKSRDS